jgi:hypothetical protein
MLLAICSVKIFPKSGFMPAIIEIKLDEVNYKELHVLQV